MATVRKLAVQHLRSHDAKEVVFSPNVTVITGPNGSGKTTLIEALYVALQGSSFKGSDNDMLQQEQPWWRIDLDFTDEDKRIISYDPSRTTGKKKFVIDTKTSYRLPPKYRYPVVLFEPDDLRLLHGSPSRRRTFIDRFITQLNPYYGTQLRRYERALKQRNNLLKRPASTTDDLFAWNIALSEYGAYVIEQRILFIERINTALNDAYHDIAQSHDTVTVHYSHTFIGDIKQRLISELHARTERDMYLGSTSVGPHRHDVIFQLNNTPALSVASRGEVRTIILALKFLEVDIIEQITGLSPIILLDDVFSELDIARQRSLSDTIRRHQIVITGTHVLSDSESYAHIKL